MRFAWNQITQYICNTYDLFICSASFEERCLSFAQHCPRDCIKFALICYNIEYNDYISKNLETMRMIFSDRSIEYSEATLLHKDPITSTDTFMHEFNKLVFEKRVTNVLIDTTSFTHEMLLIILRIFNDLHPEMHITFVYSNAEDYDPQKPKKELSENSKWLSKGISEIRSVLGYPGNTQPTNATHLLIVVGYEYDRALSIISELEPSSLSLVFGKSDSYTTETDPIAKHYGAKDHFDELTKAAFAYFPEEKFHSFEISCNSPAKAKSEIKSYLQSIGVEKNRNNTMIFALNNKLSTLGVGLFALENDDVQLCYAPALLYNYENYSTPGRFCYLFEYDRIKGDHVIG